MTTVPHSLTTADWKEQNNHLKYPLTASGADLTSTSTGHVIWDYCLHEAGVPLVAHFQSNH